MRGFLFLMILSCCQGLCAQSIWINELHYDNSGADTDEFIEVISDVISTDISLFLYNGINGLAYDSVSLDSLEWMPTDSGHFAVIWQMTDLQNGSPDGIALISADSVIEALSYEGAFTGMNGPAEGVEFTDIGIRQDGTTAPGLSLQRSGYGSRAGHFSWTIAPATAGAINFRQVITTQPLIIIPNTPALSFAETPAFDHSAPKEFTFYAVNIIEPLTIYIPPGFEISLQSEFSETFTFSSPLAFQTETDWIPPTRIYVRFCPTEPKPYSDVILFDHPDAGIKSIPVSGTEGLPDKPRAWINEFHYDNEGTDTLEFVEIAIRYPEYYDLSEIELYLYNGINGSPYLVSPLDLAWAGERDNESNYQLYVFELTGIQNGPSDGIALAYKNFPLHFISYEGSFTGLDGPFAGRPSNRILPEQDNSTPPLSSIQLVGEGSHPDDFDWVLVSGSNTMGKININQVLPLQLLSFSLVQGKLNWTVSGETNLFGYQVLGFDASGVDTLRFIHAQSTNSLINEYSIHIDQLSFNTIRVNQVSYSGIVRHLFTIPVKPGLLKKPRLISTQNDYCVQFPESWLGTDIIFSLQTIDGRILKQLYDSPGLAELCIGHWLNPLPSGNYFIRMQNREEDVVIRFTKD